MKYLLAIALLCSGCTITKLDPTTKRFSRWSLLQRVEFREVTVKSDGSIVIRGYDNDGGNEAVTRITAAAVKAAVEGMKP